MSSNIHGTNKLLQEVHQEFLKDLYPITSLQNKRNNFEWCEYSVSFEKLKNFLTNALVLKIRDSDKEFLFCT